MRVIVADDSGLLREGIVGLLQRQGYDVLAQAATAPELLAAVDAAVREGTPPDVVITDVRMPPGESYDGLECALHIRRTHPAIGILVVSQYVAPAYAAELFARPALGHPASPVDEASGGLGYLLKDRISRVTDFMHSLSAVAAGGVVVDPEVVTSLIRGRASLVTALSPRELEVLQLMSTGLSNPQISERLHLSAGAVSKHVANVFTKLKLPPEQENRRVRAVLIYQAVSRPEG